ncbi:hypothetical protein TNIN_2921 [Trichonephila inaurata madagascariensis]|uniref:Uncharacterized protein n=1 Tax=Trichonephila inaurata madagascariensis TaxID=2747483 RepID=A0A8X7CPI1_9ARAC|nr:hypothetical protein TNIN_2921 [Trichonephila inaurata madagascariensis]
MKQQLVNELLHERHRFPNKQLLGGKPHNPQSVPATTTSETRELTARSDLMLGYLTQFPGTKRRLIFTCTCLFGFCLVIAATFRLHLFGKMLLPRKMKVISSPDWSPYSFRNCLNLSAGRGENQLNKLAPFNDTIALTIIRLGNKLLAHFEFRALPQHSLKEVSGQAK